ncbi:hypothetical protein MRB53_008495 [Persea americana]|uniref:Uncharacterized protein n=1 Tax=Persea americana TaxID=3435 RepID=A0ACC2MLZ6_PERAE|nr:hypothetical protein MRB53_008495 [Persea americana]
MPPTTNPTSWLSPSGRFACRFYPEGSGFAVGICLANNQSQHDNCVGMTLQSASSASLLDSGNFVLYNTNSHILWQSFDYPTDTVLVGQSLKVNNLLISSTSITNHSAGGFVMAMFRNGKVMNLPIIRTDTIHDIYWTSNTSDQGYNVSLKDDGRIYLLNSTGFSIKNLTSSGYPRNPSVVYHVTLDVDGIFRLYSHDFSSNSSTTPTVLRVPFRDGCRVNGLCGLNSYCPHGHQSHVLVSSRFQFCPP